MIGLVALTMLFSFGIQYTMAGTWESNFDAGQSEGWDVLVGDWAVVDNTFEAFDETSLAGAIRWLHGVSRVAAGG